MELNVINKEDLNVMANYIIEVVCQKLAGSANNMQQPKLYNNQEACKYLNVCNKTLQNYRDGGLIAFRQIGRKICYTQEDLNNFLQKNIQQPFK